MLRRFFVSLGLVTAFVTAACSAPPGKGTLVVACEPGTKDCPDDKHKKSASGSPVGDPTPAIPPPAPAPTPTDAGTAEGGKAMGPACKDLNDCCTALDTAGITGSARQCRETVAGKVEIACSVMHTDFMTPGETYDPVCF
jgi:hypothetical protein